MQNLKNRTTGTGSRTLRSAAILLALCAGTCTALAQPRNSTPGGTPGNTPASGNRGFQTQPVPQNAGSSIDRSGEVTVDDDLTVELHVRDEDLANVLQLLSLQSQRSIIAGPNVNASVTANLYGVTFYEALDAVLHTYGYAYVEQGNMIYVMTREEADAIWTEGRLPVAKIINLSYLSAVDAAEYVSPLLSDVGEIRTNGRTVDFSLNEDTPSGTDTYAGNSMMIIYDFEENVAEIEALVSQIDTRPQQVLVEATILQATLKEENAFGVDFSIIGDLDFSEFIGGPLNGINNMINGVGGDDGAVPSDGEGRGLSSTVGQTNQAGGLKIGIIDNDVAVFMRFLDEVTDTTVVSNPKILCLNRQQGRVQVGRRIGYLQTTTTDTSTQQSVEFLDTGTQLSFRPWITQHGEIRMELRPEVSRPFLRTVTDSNGSPVTIPDEDTSEIVTNVTVRDGQTIVLGGLFTESTISGRRQIPLLGDLPILGTPFRGHNDTIDRSEVIFMIKSTIMSDDTLIDQGRRGMDYVERVRIGSREGLLPFSRERRAGQMLIKAERLAAEGDLDGALYCVRCALSLKPQMPDAIRLRERLLSEPTVRTSGSMMEDIVNHEVDNRIRAARQEALAEFTSLVRDDNRWENLNNVPATTVTGVNTDSGHDGFDGFDGTEGGSFDSDRFNNEFGNGTNNNGSMGGPSLNSQSFRNNTNSNSTSASNTSSNTPGNNYSWSNAMTTQPTASTSNAQANGQTNSPSSSTSNTQANNHTNNQLQGQTQARTSTPGNTGTSTPASSSSTSASSNTSRTPAASNGTVNASNTGSSTAANTNSTFNSNAPTGTTGAATTGQQNTQPAARTSAVPTGIPMFPFLPAQATQASNVPNVQPDANGFYPIVRGNNAAASNQANNLSSNNLSNNANQAGASATTSGLYSRLAWIFGSKGRQTISTNPAAAQNQQGSLAEVQESSTSGNP